jgi:hypothetical protein
MKRLVSLLLSVLIFWCFSQKYAADALHARLHAKRYVS